MILIIEKYRDLVIVYEKDTAFVISCDSLGAIGSKEHDVLKVSEEVAGKATITVALSEALCLGAHPLVIADTLAVEMKPTGEKILGAIEKELEISGLTNVVLTGSTEENFPTSMTGMGITVVSRAKISDLKIRKTEKNMYVSLLGLPLVGEEVLNSPDVLDLKDYVKISQAEEVIEAIPVGSKGINYELGVLKKVSGLKVDLEPPTYIDLNKSGGPSTSCIIIHKEIEPAIKQSIGKSFAPLGRLI